MLAGTLVLGVVGLGAGVTQSGGAAAGAASRVLAAHVAPGPPAITSAVGGNLQATLSWTAPYDGGSPITGYVIRAYVGVVAQQSQTYATASTTETITSLVNGLDYTFTVAAVNADGTGPESPRSNVVITPFVTPAAFVTGIEARTALTPQQVTDVESGAVAPGPFIAGLIPQNDPDPLGTLWGAMLGGAPDAAQRQQAQADMSYSFAADPTNLLGHSFSSGNTYLWELADVANAIFRMPEYATAVGATPDYGDPAPPSPPGGAGPLRYRDPIFTPGQIQVTSGSYDPPSNVETYDLYQPPASDTIRQRPVMVWVHGGGFSAGDKAGERPQAMYDAERGYVVLSIDYQLASFPNPCAGLAPPMPTLWDESGACYIKKINATHDESEVAVQDAYRAVQWLRANATTYGIDPGRIAIGGESAGAFIATAVGTGQWQLPGSPADARVQAFVSMSGGLPDGDGPVDGNPSTDGNADLSASAPGYFLHGTADQLVPYSWSVKTADSLRRSGVDAYLTTWFGATHVPIDVGATDPVHALYGGHDDEYLMNSAAFLYKELDLKSLGVSGPAPTPPPVPSTAVCSATSGYWIAEADGQVTPFGAAPNYGSLVTLGVTPSRPIVGIAATADCMGYWLVASDGGLFAFGDAAFYGSMGGQQLNKPVVGMTSTPQGGYFEVGSDGGLFAFGPGANFAGSMGGQPLTKPVVGMAETPQGGYYEVASDGGLFSFGPGANFAGSMGGQPLNRPVVGMTVNPTGGYYEVASDGGIFAFGAPFHGSTGCLSLAEPILSMVASPDSSTAGSGTACGFTDPQAPGGYQFVASDGGVFSFGNATFAGSLAGTGVDDVVGLVNS